MTTPNKSGGTQQGSLGTAQVPSGGDGRAVSEQEAGQDVKSAAGPQGSPSAPAPGKPAAQTSAAQNQSSQNPPRPAGPGPQRPGTAGGAAAGVQTPPWQRGQQNAPQHVPQTNLTQGVGKPVVGTDPVQGAPKAQDAPRQSSTAQADAQPGTASKGVPGRPVVTGTVAAKAAADAAAKAPAGTAAKVTEQAAAKIKAAVIDGPTRHIERNDLPKDMPDLSGVRHPKPTATPTLRKQPVMVAAGQGEPLRATVQLRKIDPWSTLKISALISISLFFVWMVAVGLLYVVLDGMGVWERLNSAFTDIVSESGSGGLVTAGQVFGYAAVIGGINTILITALASIGAFIYNLCSDLVGGIQVTLADPD